MRLFIAIDVPEQVKQALEEIQQPELGIRWTTPDTLHLTLRFIGDVEPAARDDLVEALDVPGENRFAITLKGIGYFPPRKQPKIVWVGLEENDALMKLQSEVETACRTVGLEPDDRPFTPHITIGRVRGASKKEVLSFINQHKRFRMDDIPVEEFILYESKLYRDGAVHTPIHRFPLDPDAGNQGNQPG